MSTKKSDTSTLYPITDERLIELLAEPPAPGQQERPIFGLAPVVEGEVVEAGAGANPMLTQEPPSLRSAAIAQQLQQATERLRGIAEVERPLLIAAQERLANETELDPTRVEALARRHMVLQTEEQILLSRVQILQQSLSTALREEAPGHMAYWSREIEESLSEAAALRVQWFAALSRLVSLTHAFAPLQARRQRAVLEMVNLHDQWHIPRPRIYLEPLGEPTAAALEGLGRAMMGSARVPTRLELGMAVKSAA
jgi:hypothetical protein